MDGAACVRELQGFLIWFDPMDDKLSANQSANEGMHSESMAWAAISTLVGGPLTWGAAGWLIDRWLGDGRVFTATGVIVGFVTGIYIVYKRYGQ